MSHYLTKVEKVGTLFSIHLFSTTLKRYNLYTEISFIVNAKVETDKNQMTC